MKILSFFGAVGLLSAFTSAQAATIPIFTDDFESGTMVNWTTTGVNPLDPSTPQNIVPAGGLWSAYMNTSADRMHHNIVADNGGSELSGHSIFTCWIYDASGPASRIFNEVRSYSGGTGLPNGGTAASGTLAQLLAIGKYNTVTLPGEVFSVTKYQGRVTFGANAGWFNLNAAGSPNRSTGWHRFDIERMPDNTTINFYVDGILSRTITGAVADSWDTMILGPGLGTTVGDAWIDGMSVAAIDDPPTITCPSDMTVQATGPNGAIVNYPAPTAADDRGTPTTFCKPPSGGNFAIGTTTVTCVTTDSANQSATCSFRVTVDPPPTPPRFFSSNLLPPPDGMYVTPQQYHQMYANGTIIRNISHRRFSDSQPPPPQGGSPQEHSFGSEVRMEVSIDGGATFQPHRAPAQVAVRLTPVGGVACCTFDTEMLQLNITGGTLPTGVMVRESPTRASTGKTTIRQISGGYMIDSFFDVFTEISVDGGQTWSPAQEAAHVELRGDPLAVPPVPAPTRLLPPRNDVYVSPAQQHVLWANGIVIRDIRHQFFTQSLPPPEPGAPPQQHQFDSQVDMQLSTDGGQTFRFAMAPAEVVMVVTPRSSWDSTAVYDTEMLALNIAGGDLQSGMMFRESPTRRSEGGTAITPMSDGTHHIHSFFDVFTEISTDGGQNWMAAEQAARVDLVCNAPEVPEPSPNLPPPDDQYVSLADDVAAFAQGIIIKDVKHNRFTQSQPPPPPGGSQVHSYGSQVSFMVSTDGGQTYSPGSAPATVSVRVTSAQDEGSTRYFDTEMLQLNIQGGSLPAGVMFRESPSKASLGRTSIRQMPGDPPYYISSFFDVFTELSVNGGQTWSQSITRPMTVVLTTCTISITCPADMTVPATSSSGAVVNYPPPTVTANCPPVTGPTCNPLSGSNFPIGTTTVTCSASDSRGNQASCSFKVTVRACDLTIRCPDDMTVCNDPNSCGAKVNYPAPTVTGTCPPISVTCAPASGSSFPVGDTVVTCTATDSAGKTDQCRFTVNVNDCERPTIVCPQNIVAECQSPNGTPVIFAATATDNCPPAPTVVCAPASGSPFLPGTTTVTCTATDNSSNAASCTFTVTIRDSRPPTIVCPSNMVVQTCLDRTRVRYNADARDDCDLAPTIECTPPSGSFFEAGTTTPVTCKATDAAGNSATCTFTVTVDREPRPRMTIQHLANGGIRICWPYPSTGYRLQCTRTLDNHPNLQWLDITNEPIVINGMKCVTLPKEGRHQFYRLGCDEAPFVGNASATRIRKGDVITVTGVGFGNNPDNLCAMLVPSGPGGGGSGGQAVLPLRVLHAQDDFVTLSVGVIPPRDAASGLPTGRIMIGLGQGNTGRFRPAFFDVFVADDVWTWKKDGGPADVGEQEIEPVPTEPEPNTCWSHSGPPTTDGALCVTLRCNWPSNAWVSITARAHDSVSGAGGVDLDAPLVIFTGGGTIRDCIDRIVDVIRCAFIQQAGVFVEVSVVEVSPGVFRICVRIPNGNIDRGFLTICVSAPPPQPVIDEVTPIQATTGDIITIRGSGFGNNPNNICMVVPNGTQWIPLRALDINADGSSLTARLGPVPPDARPGPIMIGMGQGNTGRFRPAFFDVFVEDPVWVWKKRGPAGEGGLFRPIPTQPPPGTIWLHNEPITDGSISVILPRNPPWPSPAIVSVTARAHDTVTGAGGYDLDGPTVRLLGGGTTFECGERIADIVRCAFRQQAGVDIIVEVIQQADGSVRIIVRIPNGHIDRGMLTICVRPG